MADAPEQYVVVYRDDEGNRQVYTTAYTQTQRRAFVDDYIAKHGRKANPRYTRARDIADFS